MFKHQEILTQPLQQNPKGKQHLWNSNQHFNPISKFNPYKIETSHNEIHSVKTPSIQEQEEALDETLCYYKAKLGTTVQEAKKQFHP